MKNASPAVRIDTTTITNPANLIVIRVNGTSESLTRPKLPFSHACMAPMPFDWRNQLVDKVHISDTVERIRLISKRRKQQLCCELILQINDHSMLISDECDYYLSLTGITTMQILDGNRHINSYCVEMKKQPRRVIPRLYFFTFNRNHCP